MSNFLQVQGNQRHCAEAYSCTPHKRFRRLTPKLLKRAIYGRKQDMIVDVSTFSRDGRFYHTADRLFDVNCTRFELGSPAELLRFKALGSNRTRIDPNRNQ